MHAFSGAMSKDGAEGKAGMTDWDRIECFVGYGRMDAPVAFIGMEECLPPGENLLAHLERRSGYARIMPLEPCRSIVQPAWRTMCRTMLRREGRPEAGHDEMLRYQAKRLGAPGGDTLLADIMPLPRPAAGDWPDIYQARYGTREAYLAGMIGKRQRLLREVLSGCRRELTVVYGKGSPERYGPLFDCAWAPDGVFLVGEAFGGRVVVTPHFTSPLFVSNAVRFHHLTSGASPADG